MSVFRNAAALCGARPRNGLHIEMLIVIDIAYVVGTVVFFALMLAYVRGCQRLGKHTPSDAATHTGGRP